MTGVFNNSQRGVALLAVLWLTVALSFMAMATAHLVRAEVDAVSNQMASEHGYYLARGGIDAAIYAIQGLNISPTQGDVVLPAQFIPGKRWLAFEFPGGAAVVEVMPENAKINVNQATPEQLTTIFNALGVAPAESESMAAAIVEWRSPRTSEVPTIMDQYYSSLPQPYAARHAALSQVEQVMPVRGMSRDLFFGSYQRDPGGRWRKPPALSDLLTTQPTGAINPNYASYEVLRSLRGWSDAMAAAVVSARQTEPFRNVQELQSAVPVLGDVADLTSLSFGVGPAFTLTATGILPGSGVRRSVRALVLLDARLPLGFRITGWWDDWPAPQDLPAVSSIRPIRRSSKQS
jgi:general secretion pathway protein K